MATISGLYTLCSTSRPKSLLLLSSTLPIQAFRPQNNANTANPNFALVSNNKQQLQSRRKRRVVRSVAEETLVPEEAEANASPATADEPVSVPVSPSDVLTMFFQVPDPCKFFLGFWVFVRKIGIWKFAYVALAILCAFCSRENCSWRNETFANFCGFFEY